MKNYPTTARSLFLIAFVVTALLSCSKSSIKENEPEPVETEGCKIIGRTYETTSYDAFGNVTSNPAKWERRTVLNDKLAPVETIESSQFIAGGKIVSKSFYRNSYEYNLDDLFIKIKNNSESTYWQSDRYITNYDSASFSYKYENKKLVQMLSAKGVLKYKYEYSLDGKLSKVIYINDNGDQVTNTFTNGILTGVIESKPIPGDELAYNKMGFLSIAKYKSISQENRYFYDEAGLLVKRERYSRGVLDSYTSYTYDAPNLQPRAGFVFKGHPTIPPTLGSDAKLLKQVTTFSIRANSNDFVKASQSDYVYEFNSTGYYTSLRVNATNYKTDGQIVGTTKSLETFVYQNCK